MMVLGSRRLAIVLLATACVPPTPAPPVAAPTPAPPVEPPTPTRPPEFRVPPPSRAANRLIVQSAVLASDSVRRDSSATTADLLLRHGPRGFELYLVRDEPAVALDSLPPIAQDSTGRWSGAVVTLPCREPGPLPSPLVARLLVPRQATRWPVRDTLQWTTCARGAPRRWRVEVEWLAPKPADDHTNYTQQVRVTGTFDGDSTRAFPMRSRGSLEGRADLRVAAPEGRLTGSSGSVTVDLEATANALRQRARQVVVFTATPRP